MPDYQDKVKLNLGNSELYYYTITPRLIGSLTRAFISPALIRDGNDVRILQYPIHSVQPMTEYHLGVLHKEEHVTRRPGRVQEEDQGL